MHSHFRQEQLAHNTSLLEQLVSRLDRYNHSGEHKVRQVQAFLDGNHKFMEQSQTEISRHLNDTLQLMYIHNLT